MSEEEQKHLQRKRRNRMRMRALQREERDMVDTADRGKCDTGTSRMGTIAGRGTGGQGNRECQTVAEKEGKGKE